LHEQNLKHMIYRTVYGIYTNIHVIANQFIAWKNICRVRPIKKLFAASD